VTHFTTRHFWDCYNRLPSDIRDLADKNYQLLRMDSRHPSLHLKKIDGLWSVRVGRNYRALGLDGLDGIVWFWIGSHAEYEKLVP
jgi:hypothetical protein